MPAMPTATAPKTSSICTAPVGIASPELTVLGPTASVFADLLSVVTSGGADPVFADGTISVLASCVVVCVPVALGSGGVTVVGATAWVFADRELVNADGVTWRG